MRKFLIVPLDNNNLKEKAREFSELLHKLRCPHRDARYDTKHIWGVYKHPTLALGAMEYDTVYEVPLLTADSRGVEWDHQISLIEDLIDLRYGMDNLTTTQKNTIRNFVKNNDSATVEQILDIDNSRGWGALPAQIQFLNTQEMIDNGWEIPTT